MTWLGQQAGAVPAINRVGSYPNVDALLSELKEGLAKYDSKPNLVVIGALGRSGSGAVDLGEAA